MNSNRYDAVVIGAGNGGLCAALSLAVTGKKVLILEKHNVPGGFATSFLRGRFEFEASLHELCDYGNAQKNGSVYELFEKYGVEDKIEFVDAPEAFGVYLPDGTNYKMPFGVSNFINKMEEYVPGSRRSMVSFFELAKECKEAMDYISECQGHPDTKVLMKQYGNFMRVAAYPMKDVFHTLKIPKLASEILSTYWSYLGSPASKLSFVHYAIMVYLYITLKAQIPKGRSHDISLTLANRLTKLGGKIRYGAEVNRILVKEGKVIGLRLLNGEEILCSHIISNASPHNVYSSLIDKEHIPTKALQLANARQLGARGFCVFLGLNKSPEELELTEYSYFIYQSLDSDQEYERMKSLSNTNSVTVCLNNADPDCSMPGTTILLMTSLYFNDCFTKEVTEENYFELKEKLANGFIEAFEKATNIKIKDAIEEIEIATPVTYAHYTNAVDGNVYGYFAEDYDNLLPRLMNMEAEGYLKGLQFCGGHSVRLSGYSSSYLSGDIAAGFTLLDMKGDESCGTN